MVNKLINKKSKLFQRDENQIEYLKRGGNKRFKDFLKDYKVPDNALVDYKYLIRAADYYRKILRAEVKGEKFNVEKPDLVNGLELLNLNSNNFKSNDYFYFSLLRIKK